QQLHNHHHANHSNSSPLPITIPQFKPHYSQTSGGHLLVSPLNFDTTGNALSPHQRSSVPAARPMSAASPVVDTCRSPYSRQQNQEPTPTLPEGDLPLDLSVKSKANTTATSDATNTAAI